MYLRGIWVQCKTCLWTFLSWMHNLCVVYLTRSEGLCLPNLINNKNTIHLLKIQYWILKPSYLFHTNDGYDEHLSVFSSKMLSIPAWYRNKWFCKGYPVCIWVVPTYTYSYLFIHAMPWEGKTVDCSNRWSQIRTNWLNVDIQLTTLCLLNNWNPYDGHNDQNCYKHSVIIQSREL